MSRIRFGFFAFALALLLVAPGQTEESSDAHVTIEDPFILEPDEANRLYDKLKTVMRAGYAMADYPAAGVYMDWKRYNTAPFLSATHGQRYVNSYANARGKDFGNLAQGARYPEGTIFAKDSLSAIAADRIFPGALFLMEKLPEGGHPQTADWRYVMILPDGSLFGDTMGENAKKVAYCHTCHLLRKEDDYVFFVPEELVAE